VVTCRAFNTHKTIMESHIKDHDDQLSKITRELEDISSRSGLTTKVKAILAQATPFDLKGVFPVLDNKISTISKDLGSVGDAQSQLRKTVASKASREEFTLHKTDVHGKLMNHALTLSELDTNIKQKPTRNEVKALVSTQLETAMPKDLPSVLMTSDRAVKAVQDDLQALKAEITQKGTDFDLIETAVEGPRQAITGIRLDHSVLKSRVTSLDKTTIRLDKLMTQLDAKQRTLDKGRHVIVSLINHEIESVNNTIEKLQSRVKNVEEAPSGICKIGDPSPITYSTTPPTLAAQVANKLLDIETRLGGTIKRLANTIKALQAKSRTHQQEAEESKRTIKLLSVDVADLRAEWRVQKEESVQCATAVKLLQEESVQCATAVKLLQEENLILTGSIASCTAAFREQKVMIEALQAEAGTARQLPCDMENDVRDLADRLQETDGRHTIAIARLNTSLATVKDDTETRDTVYQADIVSLKESRYLQSQFSDKLAARFRQAKQDVLARVHTLETDTTKQSCLQAVEEGVEKAKIECLKSVEDGLQNAKAECLRSLEKDLKASIPTYPPPPTPVSPTAAAGDPSSFSTLRDIASSRLDTMEIDVRNLRRHVEERKPLPSTVPAAKRAMNQKYRDRTDTLQKNVKKITDQQESFIMALKQVSPMRSSASTRTRYRPRRRQPFVPTNFYRIPLTRTPQIEDRLSALDTSQPHDHPQEPLTPPTSTFPHNGTQYVSTYPALQNIPRLVPSTFFMPGAGRWSRQ